MGPSSLIDLLTSLFEFFELEDSVDVIEWPLEEVAHVVRLLVSPIDVPIYDLQFLYLSSQLIWICLWLSNCLERPRVLFNVELEPTAVSWHLLAERVKENRVVQV